FNNWKFNSGVDESILTTFARDVTREGLPLFWKTWNCQGTLKFRKYQGKVRDIMGNLNRDRLKVETVSLQHQCGTCGKCFDTLIKLSRHMWGVHKPKIIPCEFCPEKFRRKSVLDQHRKTKHLKDNYLKCEVCDHQCFTKRYLKLHVDTIHLKKYVYYCPKCQKGFNCRATLNRHGKTVHEGFRFTCRYCNKLYTSEKYLKIHLKIHDPKYKIPEYQCMKCPKVFKASDGTKCYNRQTIFPKILSASVNPATPRERRVQAHLELAELVEILARLSYAEIGHAIGFLLVSGNRD
ncbi:hypothetical protein NQ317_003548, partial [Molorchus minor]